MSSDSDIGYLARSTQALDAMAVKWDEVVQERVGRRRRRIHDQVAGWRKALQVMQAEQLRLREAGLWVGGPSDVLTIAGYGRAELAHSAVVAWLLDPGMRHGLGARMLERILARCFPGATFSDLVLASSSTEITREEARIDILVEAPGLTLVIENKVDAPESPGQCDMYYRLFGDEPGARFVFLSPGGRQPTTATRGAAEAFKTLSYGELAEDLRAVLADTADERPGRARDAAMQYLRTLERQFP